MVSLRVICRYLALCVGGTLFLLAGEILAAGPDSNNQSTTSLQRQVQQRAADFLHKHEMVGLSIGTIGGETSFTLNLGKAKAGSGEETTSATLYEIGSVTKTFTAVELARQVLEGRLQYTDPVEDLLPEGQRVPENGGEPIRLIHLATHTSGLPRIPASMIFALMLPGNLANPYEDYDEQYLYDYLSSATIWRRPGKKYEYSNLGAGLLGLALARVHGSSYESMIRQNICEPLEMHDTHVELAAEQLPRLAPGYSSEGSGSREVQNWDFGEAYAGAGGLKSSVRDMMKYMAANLGLTTGSIAQACAATHETRFADGSTTIGLAWHKLTANDGSDLLIHDGATGGYSAVVALNVDRQAGVVVLSNKFEPRIGRLGIDLLELLMGSTTD